LRNSIESFNAKNIRKKNLQKSRRQMRIPFLQSVQTRDIGFFSRQMATLVSAGIPVVQALRIIMNHAPHHPLVSILKIVTSDIEKGSTLHSALAQYPKQFDSFYCALIAIGELSGALEYSLDKIATNQEKAQALKQKMKTAMIYPLTVLSVAIGVILLLLTHVVPTFKQVFQELKVELPLFTKSLLGFSNLLYQYGGIIVLMLLFTLTIIRYFYRKNEQMKRQMHRMIFKIPLMGSLIQKNILARFSSSLSTALAAGVPLTEALDTVSNITSNRVYQEAVQTLKILITQGQTLQTAMYKTAFFPQMLMQLVGIGEESGNLEMLLKKMAALYEETFDAQLSRLTILLEPLIMIILGMCIGSLVIGLYLPIFKMGSAF